MLWVAFYESASATSWRQWLFHHCAVHSPLPVCRPIWEALPPNPSDRSYSRHAATKLLRFSWGFSPQFKHLMQLRLMIIIPRTLSDTCGRGSPPIAVRQPWPKLVGVLWWCIYVCFFLGKPVLDGFEAKPKGNKPIGGVPYCKIHPY